MRSTALWAIRIYQRHVSPHKGFCCAYRAYTGGASCSALGARAIRRFGVHDGIGVLRARLHRCGVAQRRLQEGSLQRRPLARHRGDCDLSCDLPTDIDCNLPSLRGLGRVCDLFSGCGDVGSCDWSSKDTKRRNDRAIHLPKRRGRG